MPKRPRPWIVTRHDPIEELDDNLWAVNGDVPGFPRGSGMPRRMCIIKLADGRLVFHNAMPLEDDALAKIRAWGKPSILILPVYLHAIDAAAFQQKLELAVFTSKVKLEAVRALLPGIGALGPLEDLPQDPALQCVPLAGSKFGEPAFVVKSGPRASLLFTDAVQNSRPGTGFGGFMFKLFGFTGPHPKAPPAYKKRAVSDKAALKQSLLALAETPGLVRIVPSHGELISQEPATALRNLANQSL